MNRRFSKKPLAYIPIELLDLDKENPRLLRTNSPYTELDLLHTLYEQFNLDELAYSIVENGYFDEEPIVVMPTSPIEFPEDKQGQIDLFQSLIKTKQHFVVLEGNRRIATIKILLDTSIRGKLKVSASFPIISDDDVRNDLMEIPAILYPNRDDIAPYLGVRHIVGLTKWEAFQKAVYISKRLDVEHKKGGTIEDSIAGLQKTIGDRSDVIKKQYVCYKTFQYAEDAGFPAEGVRDRFSLITVALNSPSIRAFIGIPAYKDVDFNNEIIPMDKRENLVKLFQWIYGDKQQGIAPILTDSRNITKQLAPVLASTEATNYLLNGYSLSEAFERTDGELALIKKKLQSIIRDLKNLTGIVVEYNSDSEVKSLIEDAFSFIKKLNNIISKE